MITDVFNLVADAVFTSDGQVADVVIYEVNLEELGEHCEVDEVVRSKIGKCNEQA